MFVKWQVLANQAVPPCWQQYLLEGWPALAAGSASGIHTWQKTLLGKAGTVPDLDGVSLVYT